MCWGYLDYYKRVTVLDTEFLYFIKLMTRVNIYMAMSCKDCLASSCVYEPGYLLLLNVQTKEHITVVCWTHTTLIIPPHDRHINVLQTWQWKPIAANSIQHGSTDSQPQHQMCHLKTNFVIRRQKAKRNSHRKGQKRCNSIWKCIVPCLYKIQHVSGDTPPIIRSLKLQAQSLVLHTCKDVGRAVVGRCHVAYATWQ
jgi:hypothetical protein